MKLDSRSSVHLEWMFENQPDLVRQLNSQNKLAPHLEEKNQQALRRVEQLKREAGMSEDQAFEAASREILAPPDGPAMSDNPPVPVPWKEQEQIYSHLEKQ